ncbi:hypothetical protein SCP_0306430 [Sparassis crispa]|uniref:Uncharacterized protein n=1 Tax=Sparassis crispa TaxID=139825 RepID=A0A401GFL9_9APHY|nr:hypothetical protein SCP_0306430 [Sparassis crispa]GBE80921.1 hypothetical protein SCP_0306430 [Sparassis crispa]
MIGKKGTQGKEDNQVTDATVVDVTVVVAGMVVVEKASTVLVLVNVVVVRVTANYMQSANSKTKRESRHTALDADARYREKNRDVGQ